MTTDASWESWSLPVKAKLVADGVGDGLSVCCRSGAATEDMVMDRGEFISHPVRNVGPVTTHTNQEKHQIFTDMKYTNLLLNITNVNILLKTCDTFSYPVVVRESAPITTPSLNSTAMMVV